MKNILYLNYEFPPLGGGASSVSFELAETLSKTKQYNIDVVTMSFNHLPGLEIVNDRLRIHRVRSWRHRKDICYPYEQAIYLLAAYLKCKKLIASRRYDICYAHFIIPTGILALFLKKKFGLNYVITSHGSDVLDYNPRFKYLYWLVNPLWHKVISGARALSSPSEYLRREILSKIRQKDQPVIQIIPNGIYKTKFSPLQKTQTILLVSRLTQNKGIQDFIASLKTVNLKKWKVIVVGDGPYHKHLQSLACELGLSDRIHFAGWLDNSSPQLKNFFGQASIFVLASRFENFNVSLLEAMQSGCAIISSDVGGNHELLGSSGLLVRANNPAEIGRVLQQLIDHPQLSRQFSRNAQQQIKKYYWENLIPLYEKLLFEVR